MRNSSVRCKGWVGGLVRRRGEVSTCVVVASLLVVMSGCTSARLNHFKSFAETGIAYADASDQLLRAAGALTIDETSQKLVLARSEGSLPPAQLESSIKRANEQDRRYLATLRDIQKHGKLMRNYFVAINTLATSGAPDSIGESAANMYGAMAQLGNQLRGTNVLGQGRPTLKAAVTFVVGRFQVKTLEDELKARSALLERELALQEALMEQLAAAMQAKLASQLAGDESALVVVPYTANANLPKDWTKQRARVLTAGASVDAANAAAKSAQKLRKAFVKLVENRYELADYQLVLQDLNEVVALVELIQTQTGN